MKFQVGFYPDIKQKNFKSIQSALEYAHSQQMNLYENDVDGVNILYSPFWDTPMRRAVWRTLRSEHGLSAMDRMSLPVDLRDGTVGPDFEVT